MPLLSTHETKLDFKTTLAGYRVSHHGARPYDIAQALNVSELQVLMYSTDIMTVTPLDIGFAELFEKFADLGFCMALTRNDSTVSEVKGVYGKPSFHGPMGMVHHDTIDLRMFTNSWGFVVAVEQIKGQDALRSFQIFDKQGRAIHKVYPQGISSEAWQSVLEKIPPRVLSLQDIEPKMNSAPLQSVPDIDAEALRSDWLKLEDTHDFHALLRKHKADRLMAFELVGQDLAREVPVQALVDVIGAARKAELSFMVFVGNGAMIQIRSGVAKETRMLGSWFNILDPDFNLHVNMQKLKHAWLVNKPSRHGVVSSLEVFDEQGELALTLFGYRTDNLPVDPSWAKLLDAAIAGCKIR
ncbi:MAG: ChuX/HutX family heme-like substrate-binding protein [Bdellovibrionota bacterium]